MALHVALTHRTQYRYSCSLESGPCRTAAPRPALPNTDPGVRIADHAEAAFSQLAAGSARQFLGPRRCARKDQEFTATVDLVADMAILNPFDFFVDEQAVHWPFSYEPVLANELKPYLEPLPGTASFDRYLANIATPAMHMTTIDFVIGLNRRLSQAIAYRVRKETGVQTPEETLASGSGSCRDSGWLLVQVLRRVGLAARFVSGYLIQLRSDVRSADGPAGASEDFADLHAWAEVFIPGAGWIGLDPTSGLLASEGHIPLAATPSPISAAPIVGTHGEAEVDFSVSMRVERMRETPRVTKPYSDAQWQDILATGAVVENRLQAGGVRLSMGGEPTFVALEDGMTAEWNMDALGPRKRVYADKLARRLRERFAKGGLLHYGQGKWYPGELAARWAFGIYWRADGLPQWENPGLIADENPSRPATFADAERFAVRALLDARAACRVPRSRLRGHCAFHADRAEVTTGCHTQ